MNAKFKSNLLYCASALGTGIVLLAGYNGTLKEKFISCSNPDAGVFAVKTSPLFGELQLTQDSTGSYVISNLVTTQNLNTPKGEVCTMSATIR